MPSKKMILPTAIVVVGVLLIYNYVPAVKGALGGNR